MTAEIAKRAGMGSHHSSRAVKDEWLTPRFILDALGPFDLDPCAPIERPWEMAAEHFTIADDGLLRDWHGFVWCNPPYGSSTGVWLRKLHAHGNGIALIFARTETADFVDGVWARADAAMFLHGRLFFHHVDGSRAKSNSGAPSVLVAYGAEAVDRMGQSGLAGTLIKGWPRPSTAGALL